MPLLIEERTPINPSDFHGFLPVTVRKSELLPGEEVR